VKVPLFGNHFITKSNILIVNQWAYWLWFYLIDWFAWNITQAVMIMPHPYHCHKYTLRSRSTRHTVCILFTASDKLFSSLPSLIVCQFVMCLREVKESHACRDFLAVSVSQLPWVLHTVSASLSTVTCSAIHSPLCVLTSAVEAVYVCDQI